MRADRLISLLLLLQQRKKIIAQELADELDVSLRTIYRDMAVLSSSGFPVYAEKGPGGGCCIIEDFKSSIRTLSNAEVDALQMLSIPETMISLGAGQDLQRALLKIMALIPERKRDSSTLFIDWDPWNKGEKNLPSNEVHKLYEACIKRNLVWIEFILLNKGIVHQKVQPYGIAAKSGEWYLIYNFQDNFRFKNIGSLRTILVLDETFEKDEGFDLETTWKKIITAEVSHRFIYDVRVKIKADQIDLLSNSNWDVQFQVNSRSDPGKDGWVDCELGFEHLFTARAKLLSWGSAARVVSPEPLRLSVLDFARQVMEVNGG